MNEIILKVKGMMCEGCENRVKNSLKNIEGVKEVTADHNTGNVTVNANNEVSKELFIETIEDIGYEVVNEA